MAAISTTSGVAGGPMPKPLFESTSCAGGLDSWAVKDEQGLGRAQAAAGKMVNKTTGILQPGAIKVIAMDSNRAEIHIAIAKGERWTEACNNVFPLSKEYRRTIFVIDVTSSGSTSRKIPLITLLSMAEATVKPVPSPSEQGG